MQTVVLTLLVVSLDEKTGPSVSPNKSVEGLYGGVSVAAIIIVVVAWIYLDLTLIQYLLFIILSVVTVLGSVLGDLLSP